MSDPLRKGKAMMKRLIAMLLAVLLLIPCGAALGEGTDEIILDEDVVLEEEAADGEAAPEEEEELIPWAEYDFDWLEVGNPTVTDGKFFTGCWGNATTDIDVRTLLHRYLTVVWDGNLGMFSFNHTVVSGSAITENEAGDRTYYLALYKDLFFSDGTPITAWDYAFSLLLMIDPKINELGFGQAAKMPFLEGYDEYIGGEVPYLSGLRVLTDYFMTFTVKHEYLPYFFELYRLGLTPYPIHVIAPGCKVYDDGEGVYIANEDRTIEEPIFTTALLEQTIMDPDTGYLTHPSVNCGPYVLTYYGPRDGYVKPTDEAEETPAEESVPEEETPEEAVPTEAPEAEPKEKLWEEVPGLDHGADIIAVFEINPYFKGDEHGDLPAIKRICFRLGVNETMIDELAEGKFALLNKVLRKDAIEAGIALSGDQFRYDSYPRIGLSFITFVPDVPALQEKNVRKAIAHCLEKDEVVERYVGEYGVPVDGFYGIGQWMYGLTTGTLTYAPPLPEQPTPEDEAAVEALLQRVDALSLDNLVHYEPSVETAIELLEKNGWTLNENGEPYVRGRDTVRYKLLDGELTGLDFKMGYPYTNIIAPSLEELHLPNLLKAGIRVELVPMEMKDLHIRYDFRDADDVEMFYLGDDFNIEFDPTLWFLPGDASDPEKDNLAWVHAKMYDLAEEMCRTEPYDPVTFVEKWVVFQEVFSDLLPMIPVYDDLYFDFYTKELHNYEITKYVTWGEAIVPARFSEWTEEDEAAATGGLEGEETLDDGEIILDD